MWTSYPDFSWGLRGRQKLRQGDEVLVGEAGGSQLEAFDFSNSPLEVRGGDLGGKIAVLTTSNGTRAAQLAVLGSDKVLLACLNNATAACRLAAGLADKEVAILCARARVTQVWTTRTPPEHSRLGSSA